MIDAELLDILDQLEPGMAIVVPEVWIQSNIPGPTDLDRAANVASLAAQTNCNWREDPTTKTQVFTKN